MSLSTFALPSTPRQASNKENAPHSSFPHGFSASSSPSPASSHRARQAHNRHRHGGSVDHSAKPYARGRSPCKGDGRSRSSQSVSPRKAGYATLSRMGGAEGAKGGKGSTTSTAGWGKTSKVETRSRGPPTEGARPASPRVVLVDGVSASASTPAEVLAIPSKSPRIQQALQNALAAPKTSTEEVHLMRLIGPRRLLASSLYEPTPLSQSAGTEPRSELAYRFRQGVAGSSKLEGMAWWYAPSHVLVVRPSRKGTRVPHLGGEGKQAEMEVGTLMPIHAPVYRTQCSRFAWQPSASASSQQITQRYEEARDLRLVSMALGSFQMRSPSPPEQPGQVQTQAQAQSVAAWAATVPLPSTPYQGASTAASLPASTSSGSQQDGAVGAEQDRPLATVPHPAFAAQPRNVSGSSGSTQSTKVDTIFSSLGVRTSIQASSVTSAEARVAEKQKKTSADEASPDGYNAELDTWDLLSEYDSDGEPYEEVDGDASGSSWETVSAADPTDPEHAPLAPQINLRILHVSVPYPSLLHIVNGWLYTANDKVFMLALVGAAQLPPSTSRDILERVKALDKQQILLRLARLDAIAANAQYLGVVDVDMWKLIDRAWSVLVDVLRPKLAHE